MINCIVTHDDQDNVNVNFNNKITINAQFTQEMIRNALFFKVWY